MKRWPKVKIIKGIYCDRIKDGMYRSRANPDDVLAHRFPDKRVIEAQNEVKRMQKLNSDLVAEIMILKDAPDKKPKEAGK